ncbi:MAG: sigma-54 dependent transcriptional regulator [Acidobacteriota bacterium]
MSRTRALVVDDDPTTFAMVRRLAELEDLELIPATSLTAARDRLRLHPVDLALCALSLPDGSGLELLADLGGGSSASILLTERPDPEATSSALRLGVTDTLTKPIDIERLRALLTRVRRTLDLQEENGALRNELRALGRFGDLIGASAAMQAVYDEIERLAPASTPIIIVGEAGTGKDLVASTLHARSRRRHRDFVALDCGTIGEAQLARELFGRENRPGERIARRQRGAVERASGGTLFLASFTALPLALQSEVCRMLENRRLGGRERSEIDVRVLLSMGDHPKAAAENGRLHADLLSKLRAVPIELPPLHLRGKDDELLARHFLAMLNARAARDLTFSAEALARIHAYRWPGNVRELKQVVERAFDLAEDEIGPEQLPIDAAGALAPDGSLSLQVPVGKSIAEVERRLIFATMDACDQNKRSAAKTLGISLKTLYNRLNAYAAAEQRAAEERAASGSANADEQPTACDEPPTA